MPYFVCTNGLAFLMTATIRSQCRSCTSAYTLPRAFAEAQMDADGQVRIRCRVCDHVWSIDCGHVYRAWVLEGDEAITSKVVASFEGNVRVTPFEPVDLKDLTKVPEESFPDLLIFGRRHLKHPLIGIANSSRVTPVFVTQGPLKREPLPASLSRAEPVSVRWSAGVPPLVLPRFQQPAPNRLVMLYDVPRPVVEEPPVVVEPPRATIIDELGLSDDFLSGFLGEDGGDFEADDAFVLPQGRQLV